MSNFAFLEEEHKKLFDICHEMELNYFSSPRTVCFYGRLAVESFIKLMYKYNCWSIPGNGTMKLLMTTQDFVGEFEPSELEKLKIVRTLGNTAVHRLHTNIEKKDSDNVIRIVFNFATWFSHCYGELNEELAFSEDLIISPLVVDKADEHIKKQEIIEDNLDHSIENIIVETPVKKKQNKKFKDDSMTEKETRKWFIDTMLREVGWNLSDKTSVGIEFPVANMPKDTNPSGKGAIDYVLWGENMLPVAIVEAKRTMVDPLNGEHQGRIYADCLEEIYGQRPVIFLSNGFTTYILDDHNKYPKRRIFGFYRRDELNTLIQRRELLQDSSKAISYIDRDIIDRDYQKRAVTKTIESIYSNRRKALLVMATGSGKTRTAIALVKALLKAQRIKRVLFLADRINLSDQAKDNFTKLLEDTSVSTLLDNGGKEERNFNARILFSTYQTMMGMLEKERPDGTKLFGVGHFDLIIVDESHRSLYNKYGLIFEYFDALLFGLTATPKNELGFNTFKVFNLPNGEPTDSYDLSQAVTEGYLVPPRTFAVESLLPKEGIKYDELDEAEKEQYEEFFADEDGNIPDMIEGRSINDTIKNKDTIRKMLDKLMTNGYKVENGDLLGKTIIFTNRDDNAKLIVDVFNEMYPHLGSDFCQRITNKVSKHKNILNRFKDKNKLPQIAVSVDMLDTGIDVPEVLNLVLYKKVFSKSKFWQMLGRGTRLCPDVYGIGVDKEDFLVFDYFGNIDYFKDASYTIKEDDREVSAQSMTQRIFNKQITLLRNLQHYDYQKYEEYRNLYDNLLNRLHENILGIPESSIFYTKEKEYIRKYRDLETLQTLDEVKATELKEHLSYIPYSNLFDDTSAKWFDSLMLNLQLSKVEKVNINRDLAKCRTIAEGLKENAAVPKIRERIDKIELLSDSDRLQEASILEVEEARVAVREILNLIPKKDKGIYYTDFKDTIIREEAVDLSDSFGEYKSSKNKLKEYLAKNDDRLAIKKLKNNIPIETEDLKELEELIFSSEVALTPEELENSELEISKEYKKIKSMYSDTPLTYFIRSLIGMEQSIINSAFAEFISSHSFTGAQLDLIELVKNNYIHNGLFRPEDLMGDKVKSLHHMGVRVLQIEEIKELKNIIDGINSNATLQ